MADRPEFQQRQLAFTAHLRDPDHVAPPEGVEERRIAVYRKLLFNNLKTLLSNMFPVLRKIHEPDRWSRLIREFMVSHRASTPYFMRLPGEFVDFLQNNYVMQPDDFPFLLELAHYEYVELALSVSEASNELQGVDPAADLLASIPVKSELAWAFAYGFPVHRIGPGFQPTERGDAPTCLAVYRDHTDKVGFLELNPVTAGLLDAIENNQQGLNGEALLRKLAAETGYPDEDAFVAHGGAALRQLLQLEILVGGRTLT